MLAVLLRTSGLTLSLAPGAQLPIWQQKYPPFIPGRLATMAYDSSRTSWLGVQLPLDLGFAGAPGCALFTSVDLIAQLANAAGTAQSPCNNPAYGL